MTEKEHSLIEEIKSLAEVKKTQALSKIILRNYSFKETLNVAVEDPNVQELESLFDDLKNLANLINIAFRQELTLQ